MRHAAAPLRQQGPVRGIRLHRVRDAGAGRQHAEPVEPGEISHARPLPHELHFLPVFARMRVQHEVLLRGKERGAAQQVRGRGHGEPGLHGDPEPAALAPVPGRAQTLGFRETVFRARAQIRRRRLRIIHEGIAPGVTDPGPGRRLEQGVGMPNGSHVEHGRDAGRQAFGETGPRGDRHRLRIVRRLAGPHVPLEPRQQLQTRRPVAQQRLAEMEVRLHESGQDPLPARLEPLDGVTRQRRQPAGLRSDSADRSVFGVQVGCGADVGPVRQPEKCPTLDEEAAHGSHPPGSRRPGEASAACGRRRSARPPRAPRGSARGKRPPPRGRSRFASGGTPSGDRDRTPPPPGSRLR